MNDRKERNILDIAQEMQKRSAALNEMLKAEGMKNYLNFALQFNKSLAKACWDNGGEKLLGDRDEQA